MDPAVAKLIVGHAVQIRRSDGRLHSATVKKVNLAKSVVHVEWLEVDLSKGKEIDLHDIYKLNAELIQYLSSPTVVEISSAPTIKPSGAPKPEKKSEFPPKTSKMTASSESAPAAGPSEEPVPRRMTTRQTCLLRLPVPSTTSAVAAEDLDLPSSTIPRTSKLPTSLRRQTIKLHSLLPVTEGVSESEVSKCALVETGAARLPEVNKRAKRRTSVSLKNSETQEKKGKYGDLNRSNKQFYQMIEEYRETLEKVPLSMTDPVELHRICVCVRKRPLNKKEIIKKDIDVVTVPGTGVLMFHEPKQKVDLTKYLDNQIFHFDYSFDEDSTNDLVYRFTARPLVKTIFEGGMATCFAYGQTGSGKTHTMGGDFSGKAQNSCNGIYALAAQDVFTLLQQKRYDDLDLCPYVTFFEIYNGKVFDLLNKKAKLRVLEDENQQVQIVGLQEMPVSSVVDVIKMIEKGSACRTSGQTFANANSSRSHAVLQVILRRQKHIHGKFSLVDLAGNERGTDVSSNDRQTMVETAEINRSLLALKECIRSLGQNSEHIPFRMSKLTQVLRDSFIGENSRTCMIAMISPGMSSCNYTLNTLRYADRVKELNGASKGVVQDSSQLTEDSEMHCNSLEQESIHAELEAVSYISELERFYEDLQVGNEIARSIEHVSYDVVKGLPEINDYMEKLQGSYQALQLAIMALRTRSSNVA